MGEWDELADDFGLGFLDPNRPPTSRGRLAARRRATGYRRPAGAGRVGSPGFKKGLEHPRGKLDDDAVRAIRNRAEAGETLTTIAADYGVGIPCVSAIVKRKRRADVPDSP